LLIPNSDLTIITYIFSSIEGKIKGGASSFWIFQFQIWFWFDSVSNLC